MKWDKTYMSMGSFSVFKIITFLKDFLLRSCLINITCVALTTLQKYKECGID